MEKKDFIFGIRSILEAIESGKTIDKILIRREIGSSDLIKELISKAKEFEIPVQKVPLEKLNRITLKNHQGAIAVLSPITYYKLENLIPKLYEEGKTPLGVLLDKVTDARNFGAILRTAECAGVDFIIIGEKGCASATWDTVKASAGAVFHIPICREKEELQAVKYLKECGYQIIGASEKGSTSYNEVDYNGPTILIMGAEDTGISNNLLKNCDSLVSIPIKGKIGSLNVSVAAGIIIYAAVTSRSN